MATSSSQNPEVLVGGKHVSIEELDNLRDAVCLLKWQSKDKSKEWSGYGFYANVKTEKHGKTLDINCIITIYDDIFFEMDEHGDDMLAVFHHESDGKEAFELPLVPFKLLAHGSWRFDYALIFIDESKMEGKGVKPILADNSELPVVQPNDKVYMIHHPGKIKKHYSEDKARRVTKALIKYLANALEGPPGSPVFVYKDSKFLLFAIHCNNKREGVLVSYILNHLHIPRVQSKLPVPRQNPFVRALSWTLSWLSAASASLLEQFRRPNQGTRSAGPALFWPSFPFRRDPVRSSSLPDDEDSDFDDSSADYEDSDFDDSSEYNEDLDLHDLSVECKDVRFGSSLYGEGARLHPKIAEASRSTSDDEDTVKFQEESEWKPLRFPSSRITRIEQQCADLDLHDLSVECKVERLSVGPGPQESVSEAEIVPRRQSKPYRKPERGRKSRKSPTFAHPNLAKKVITTDGGVLNIGNFTLRIGPGCLANDTLITLMKRDQETAIKILLDLSLVDTVPRVVKFLPDGLVFLKPADVTIRLERKTVPESEHFILHGSYNHAYEKTVWELVTNDIEENNVEGVINIKIKHFSLFSYITAKRGELARILGHLNGYFTCCAYSFYRRLPAMDTIDISIVFLSEFVAQKKEEDIEQLQDHVQAGYVKGEKGFLKPVHTNRHLEVILDFPGIENPPFLFKVRQAQLDSVGFAVDHFKRIAIESPAIGAVKISEMKTRAKKESLWELIVCEIEDEIKAEEQPAPLDLLPEAQLAPLDVPPEEQPAPMDLLPEAQLAPLDVPPEGIRRFTKLTNGEIIAMSRKVGLDWENLAALIDIPYSEQEEIRVNCGKYPSLSSKAKRVFELFKESKSFDRRILVKHFQELRRQDLINEMLPVEDEGEEVCPGATATSKPEISEVQPEISEVQPETFEVQPEISEVQPEISEVQPEISEGQLQNDTPLFNSESEKVGTGATVTTRPEISEVPSEISEGQLPKDTPLSSREIHRLSEHLVINWEELAPRLGITASERDDIRYSLLYTSSHSKAKKMLAIFNNMKDFSRQKLAEYLEEIGHSELKEPVLTGEWRR